MPIPVRSKNDTVKFYKAYIGVMGIPRYDITLPNGEQITITREKPFITSVLETARFIAKSVRFISVRDATADEVRMWMYHPENLPYICKDLSDRGDIVERFKWTPSDEKFIANVLIKRGYDVHKHVGDRVDSKAIGRGEVSNKEIKLMIDTLTNAGYEVIKKEIPKPEVVEEVIEQVEEKPKPDLYDFKSMKELRAAAKHLKINSFGKTRDQLAIEVKEARAKERASKK